MIEINKWLPKITIYVFLIMVLILTLFPFIYTISGAFKSNQEILLGGINLIPREVTFENFIKTWNLANFDRYTLNSLYISIVSVVGILINSTVTAYVLQRGTIVGRKLITGIFLGSMFITTGAVSIFPLVKVASVLGINNIHGVILVNIFGINAIILFLAIGYFKTINKEIDEAARIDGCSFFRIYWNIIMPISLPLLATISLLKFLYSWNDYLLPLVFTISNSDSYPITVALVQLRNTGEGASQWNLMMAGTLFSIIPIIVTYLFLNRYFISGMTGGAIKG
jgi:ABC-type glycerol-3-phosphate transport system permease component